MKRVANIQDAIVNLKEVCEKINNTVLPILVNEDDFSYDEAYEVLGDLIGSIENARDEILLAEGVQSSKKKSSNESNIAQDEDGFKPSKDKLPEIGQEKDFQKNKDKEPEGYVKKLSQFMEKQGSAFDDFKQYVLGKYPDVVDDSEGFRQDVGFTKDYGDMVSVLKKHVLDPSAVTKTFLEYGSKKVILNVNSLVSSLRLSSKFRREIFGYERIVRADMVDDNTCQYKNIQIEGSFDNGCFIPDNYWFVKADVNKFNIGEYLTVPNNLTTDPYNRKGEEGKIIDVEDDTIVLKFKDGGSGSYLMSIWDMDNERQSSDTSRKEEARNIVFSNYDTVINKSAELIKKIKSNYLKNISISDNRFQGIHASKVDQNNNIIEGTVDYIITASDPYRGTQADLLITFAVNGDMLEFNDMFRDNYGKYYMLNTDQVNKLLG